MPKTFGDMCNLKTLSLSSNNLSGQIPMWLGSSHPNLVVLVLRSNHFSKSMPSHLCHLTNLQLLDLAINHISGCIPQCLNNLTALTHKSSPHSTIKHVYPINPSGGSFSFYDDHANWIWKGREYEFGTTLGLIKGIDLSNNILTGMIPREIMELDGLISLNLSGNFLIGRITSSISGITSLNFLNLSNNNLSGKIPTSRQLDTINASAYEGNPNLCGFPLPKKCWEDEPTQNPIVKKGHRHVVMQDEDNGFITPGFYASVALGFVVGFWRVFGTLLMNRRCRFTCFKFLNNFKDKLYVTGAMHMARLQRQLQS
jgi:EIX receptor 1/2